MILVDANVFMYAAGHDHPNKESSAAFLRAVAGGEVQAATNVEVLQEILHRYRALDRWLDGRRVYDLTRRIVPTTLPVSVEVMDLARKLLDEHPAVMARDAVHAAVVLHHELEGIVSFDRDFDALAGIERIEP